jgi:Tol biopolymer transport system component
VKGNYKGGRISPDCRWIAYFSSGSGRSEVYVQPFMANGEKFQVSLKGGISPRWRQDGKELFYMTLDGTIMAVSVRLGKTFEIAGYSSLFRVGLDEVRRTRTGLTYLPPETYPYDVTARGDRFIVNISKPVQRRIFVHAHWDMALEKK